MSWKEVPVQEIDISQVETLIDVREQDEYTDGHIPGAISIPLSRSLITDY